MQSVQPPLRACDKTQFHIGSTHLLNHTRHSLILSWLHPLFANRSSPNLENFGSEKLQVAQLAFFPTLRKALETRNFYIFLPRNCHEQIVALVAERPATTNSFSNLAFFTIWKGKILDFFSLDINKDSFYCALR